MGQNEGQIWFDLNLAVMEDEALVVLAKECEFGPARDELIVRYGSQTERLVGWLGHSHCLSRADVEDARQSAVFWTIEAINKYDTKQIGKPKGCSFRSFFYRVLVARFKDFAKHLRRIEGPLRSIVSQRPSGDGRGQCRSGVARSCQHRRGSGID